MSNDVDGLFCIQTFVYVYDLEMKVAFMPRLGIKKRGMNGLIKKRGI